MCAEENWNVPVLWQVVKSCRDDVLQPHNNFNHVNPLRIGVATLEQLLCQKRPHMSVFSPYQYILSTHTRTQSCMGYDNDNGAV